MNKGPSTTSKAELDGVAEQLEESARQLRSLTRTPEEMDSEDGKKLVSEMIASIRNTAGWATEIGRGDVADRLGAAVRLLESVDVTAQEVKR